VAPPGSPPGVEPHELPAAAATRAEVRVTCTDFAPGEVREEEVTDLDGFVKRRRPDWSVVRWIDVAGLADLSVVRALAEKYHLHPLAIEDVLQPSQRPKVDDYLEQGGYQPRLCIITRMIQLRGDQLHADQVSIFLGRKTVLTFHEAAADVWSPIRHRIHNAGSRLRGSDASFLVYALIDTIVDHSFPILEHLGDRIERLEDLVLTSSARDMIRDIHRLKRELLLLRRTVWPMREVVRQLQSQPHEHLSTVTQTYLGDVYDNAVQILDVVEIYRETTTSLTEAYLSAMSNRMGEVMKVLTVIGTIFIPLTFLAGVYGMNFRHLPELGWRHGYAAFWIACIVVAGAMLAWFRRRGWL
jgi:magnesium transporter